MTELMPIIVQQGSEVSAGLRSSVSHTLSDVWNSVVGDKIAVWRVTRMVAIQDRVQNILDKHGLVLDREKLPDHYALRWLEEASKSENSLEISDMFAKLLVESVNGNSDARRASLPSIVSSMSASDARQFSLLIKNLISNYEKGDSNIDYTFIDTDSDRKDDFSDVYSQHISLDTLSYLGLIRVEDAGGISINGGPQHKFMSIRYGLSGEDRIGVRRIITLTWLGLSLANAVLPELEARRLAKIPTP